MCQIASRELELIKKEKQLEALSAFIQNYEGADPQIKEAKICTGHFFFVPLQSI